MRADIMPKTRPLILMSAAALALAACGGGGGAPMPLTPLSQYYMQVEPGLDRIALAVHERGPSSNQGAALDALVGRWRATGISELVIQSPGGDDPATVAMTWAVRDGLAARGVPVQAIRIEGYAAPHARAPVLVGFETAEMVIPNCAEANSRPRPGFSNQPSPGLGCAITANMAAQIDDPRDILRPRAMTPADSGRAAVVFQAYRAGERTSAPQDELVRGRIARAVE